MLIKELAFCPLSVDSQAGTSLIVSRLLATSEALSCCLEIDQGEVTQLMLKPLGDRVVIEPSESEETTSGGILLPDAAKKKPQEGKVISVGPGRILDNGKRSDVGVKAGDIVVYAKYGGTEIKLDGKEYMILDAEQIYAVKD